jgi:hypothetical protein
LSGLSKNFSGCGPYSAIAVIVKGILNFIKKSFMISNFIKAKLKPFMIMNVGGLL